MGTLTVLRFPHEICILQECSWAPDAGQCTTLNGAVGLKVNLMTTGISHSTIHNFLYTVYCLWSLSYATHPAELCYVSSTQDVQG